MSRHVRPTVRVQEADFDLAAEVSALTQGRGDVGAVVTFAGLCRDEGGTLAALELEHYPGMAEREMAKVADEALSRWPLTGLSVIHRFGRIAVGDNIVLVVAASSHRDAAFDAASYMMDFLKTRAPFWKKEHRRDGTKGGWVAARTADEKSARRWDDEG
ncbi:MAG: molybdenum cofactor biosynthesis protein MoaE [Rhizobiaceae bacterium]